MAENPNVPKKHKRKHMWWRYLLVFFGGVLFTAVGAAAGAAIYSTTVPVSQVVGLLPTELQGLLTFLNENDTIYTTAMSFITGELTVDDITDGIELGNIVTKEMVGEKLYLKLCYYYDGKTDQPSESANLKLLGEGEEETTFTVPEGWHPINLTMVIKGQVPTTDPAKTVTFVDNLMNGIVISDIVDQATLDSSSILNAVKDCHINEIQSAIMDKKLNELFNSNGGLMASVGELTLNELMQDDVKSKLYLADILGVTEDSTDRLTKLLCFEKNELGGVDYTKKRTVKDLDNVQAIMDTLNIEDVIEINDTSDAILKSLKGTSIAHLSTKIGALTVADVFPTSSSAIIDWLKDEGGNPLVTKIDNNINDVPLSVAVDLTSVTGIAKGILTELADNGATLGTIGSKFGSVKLVKALASEIYEDPADSTTMKGTWKYLLYQDISYVSATKAQQESVFANYTLESFGELTTNMANNMQKATLQNLYDDGFIDKGTVSQETLNKKIGGVKLGEMTISQIIVAAASIAA